MNRDPGRIFQFKGEDFPASWHWRVAAGLVLLILAAFFFFKPLIGR
jgi:uncharacterized membrane protein HdeD (DUF308 family)